MRFSSLLFALPLLSSVFAAPLVTIKDVEVEVEANIAARHGKDYLGEVQKLKATVSACGSINAGTSKQDVISILTTVNVALGQCGSALGIDLTVGAGVGLGGGLGGIGAGLGLGAGVKVDGLTAEVSVVLAECLQIVNGLVGGISADLKLDVTILGLCGKIDIALKCLLIGINVVLKGCLQLVVGIIAKLGITINGLLSGVLGVCGPLLNGLLKGGLGGGLLGGGLLGGVGGIIGGGGKPCSSCQ